MRLIASALVTLAGLGCCTYGAATGLVPLWLHGIVLTIVTLAGAARVLEG